MVKFDKCFLDEFQGCFKFLKFVEWVKQYGLGSFKDKVESALKRENDSGSYLRYTKNMVNDKAIYTKSMVSDMFSDKATYRAHFFALQAE